MTCTDAERYVQLRFSWPPGSFRVAELGGGVSNSVMLVEKEDIRFVLKQSLARLRVEQEWLCDRSRIQKEASALRMLAPLLPANSVPQVLFEDRPNWLFAMSAAPRSAQTWKAHLLSGQCDRHIAEAAGALLASIFRSGWHDEAIQREHGDLEVFDQLRMDPYYRTTAARHPDLASFFFRLIEQYPSRCCTLVHGDWSPKNLLISGPSVTAIDFEVVHYGDPAFDAAFLLNHLLLKSFYLPEYRSQFAGLAESFWKRLVADMPPLESFEAATIEHLGALLLARIDGKSPAEYIQDPELKSIIRGHARQMIRTPPKTIGEVFEQ